MFSSDTRQQTKFEKTIFDDDNRVTRRGSPRCGLFYIYDVLTNVISDGQPVIYNRPQIVITSILKIQPLSPRDERRSIVFAFYRIRQLLVLHGKLLTDSHKS